MQAQQDLVARLDLIGGYLKESQGLTLPVIYISRSTSKITHVFSTYTTLIFMFLNLQNTKIFKNWMVVFTNICVCLYCINV